MTCYFQQHSPREQINVMYLYHKIRGTVRTYVCTLKQISYTTLGAKTQTAE